jgi:hypothetical protein
MKSIRVRQFTHDILHSRLIHLPPKLTDLVYACNTTLSTRLEVHAPIRTKTIRAKPINKWFAPALSALKSARRHIGRLWLHTCSPHLLKLLRIATN